MDEKDNIAIEQAVEPVTEQPGETVEVENAEETVEDTEAAADAEESEITDDGDDFTDDAVLLDDDGGTEPEAEEETGAEEESQTQEQAADEDAQAGSDAEAENKLAQELAKLKEELESEKREKERQIEKLKKLGYESLEDVRAYLEGVDVDEIKRRDAEEAAKEAAEAAKTQAQLAVWAQNDIAEIRRKYPDFNPVNMSNFEKFSSLRGDPALRDKMSAVEVYEFVERQKLAEREAKAAAQKIASKEHLKAGKPKNVSPAVAIPKDMLRTLRATFPGKSDKELFDLYKSVI